jgi:hypothetical protein
MIQNQNWKYAGGAERRRAGMARLQPPAGHRCGCVEVSHSEEPGAGIPHAGISGGGWSATASPTAII